MRLHFDKITRDDIYDAIHVIPGGSVTVEFSEHGSRSRSRAYEIGLTGHGERHTRSKNVGYASGHPHDERAATWDDWGFFIAALFEVDPDALWGSKSYQIYEDANHFHILTCDRFNILTVDFPVAPLPKLKRAELAELKSDGYENAKWQR